MSSVVTDACTKCKSCVAICPVDAFHEDENMLVINPETCIDCGACIPECPVNAIFDEAEMPEESKKFIQINADKSKELPVITSG